jgi:hypothetical protein
MHGENNDFELCPYLVGDYETVSNELSLYVVAG